MHKDSRKPRAIHWVRVIFAVALNMILVTLADLTINQLGLPVTASALIRLIAPFLAGVLTALYAVERAGVHAFLGGLISIPLLVTFVLPGAWPVSVLAGILCGMGGAVTEFMRRGAAS